MSTNTVEIEKQIEEKNSDITHEEPISNDTVDDLAQVILRKNAGATLPTPEEITQVVRRIDLYLMPMMITIYMLQYLDKVAYGTGTNFGALADLQLVEVVNGVNDLTRYRNGALMFWVGYIIGIFPLSILSQKLKPSRACSIVVVLWGIVFLLAPLCTTWQGIFVQRFFLGFLESGITPGFMQLTGIFYSKPEQALRSAMWWSGTGCSILLGYPIMYGVLNINMAIAKWKAIYYLWGSFTVAAGIGFFFVVPNNQAEAYFLTPRQQYVAVERLRDNQAGLENPHFKWSQVKEAFLDVRCLLMIPLAFLSIIPNACVSTFAPIVLRGMGYTPLQTIYMTLPQGATNVVIVNLYGYLQQRHRNTRALFYTISILPIILCSALLWKLPSSSLSGRFFAVTWFPTFTSAVVTLSSLTVTNVSGNTKKSIANGMFLMGYAIGQVIAPLTYPPTESPGFPTGFLVTTVCLIAAIVVMGLYWLSALYENRRRDKLGEVAQIDRAFLDLTDKENLTFRYEL